MEYYSTIKGPNNAIYSNMDGTRHSHTKWSKSERERQTPYHVYVESKIWHKWSIYKIEKIMGICVGQTRVCWGEGGSGMDREFGVSRWKLLHLEWTGNEILLYSTGIYTSNYLWWDMMEDNVRKRIYIYYDGVTLLYKEIDRTLKIIIIRNLKINK